jgi:hypothetical protein
LTCQETNHEAITHRILKLESTRLEIGGPGMTIHGNLPKTKIEGEMSPTQTLGS